MNTVYDTKKWMVHIIGPDTILAAKDFSEAVEKCNLINGEIVKSLPTRTNPYYPLVWARVDTWNEQALGIHNPEETDWSNLM